MQKRNFKKVSASILLTSLVAIFVIPPIFPVQYDERATGHLKISKNNIPYFEVIDKHTGLFTQALWQYNGTFQGYHYPLDTEIVSVTQWYATSKVRVMFSGTVGDSEKGQFQAIVAGESNPNQGYPNKFRAKLEIIPGSGTGGLKGICGSGTMTGEEQDEGKESTGTYDFHYSFTECEAN